MDDWSWCRLSTRSSLGNVTIISYTAWILLPNTRFDPKRYEKAAKDITVCVTQWEIIGSVYRGGDDHRSFLDRAIRLVCAVRGWSANESQASEDRPLRLRVGLGQLHENSCSCHTLYPSSAGEWLMRLFEVAAVN